MMDQDELVTVFVEESVEHLETIEPDLLKMEETRENVDPGIVNSIFRAVHSIKGAAGFFGFNNIGTLSHRMENLLSMVREGEMTTGPKLIDALFSGMDALRAMLDDVGQSDEFDITDQIDQLTALLNPDNTPEPVVTVTEIPAKGKAPMAFDIQETDLARFKANGQFLYTIHIHLKTDLTEKGKTPLDLIRQITTTGELIESRLEIDTIQGIEDCLDNEATFVFAFATILEENLIAPALEIPEDRITPIETNTHGQQDAPDPVREFVSKKIAQAAGTSAGAADGGQPAPEEADITQAQPSPAPAGQSQTVHAEEKIRVSINLLNELVNLAGEMVLGRNQLNQVAMPMIKDVPGLNTVTGHISRITTEMQEKIMQMRMQPVSMLFGKFQRVVRDLARKMEKEIKLVTFGEDVELDKSIIEALSDPMTHLIRNSVDHGIESPKIREKFGKPRQGTINLKAYHQAGHIYIDIQDDGGGIDGPALGEKAVEKELITKEQMKEMSDKELTKLIFKPGFSTAKQVSDVSGRGVGMDVVITNIQQLGGTVDIETKLYKGTTISLVLPLTLAIVTGLVTRTSNNTYILPEANIDELVRIKPNEIKDRINTVQRSKVLRLRDNLLPLVSLARVLGLSRETENSRPEDNMTEPMRILVLKHGSSRFGLIVDAVENIEEIVVKPLPRFLSNQPCFSGASIMGNGSIAMILDVTGLFDKARLHHVETKLEKTELQTGQPSPEKDLQTLLLFDNGTSERFALPLELISRIEKVSPDDIEKVKDQYYLQYQGDKLRLVFLEKHLPVDPPDRSEAESMGIIVPKPMKYPMGIVIGTVHNTVNTAVEIDTRSITSPGLFGSAILAGKITLMPDMYRLFELAAPDWYTDKTGAENTKTAGKRILVVEDTPFFRMIETDYLNSAGYEALSAENGKQALAVLNKEPVDAVIMDIVMPEMDGWETIRAIRADPGLKSLPVMAVTSLADDAEAEQKSKTAGFDQWEAKLNKERLLEKLARMLTMKKEVA